MPKASELIKKFKKLKTLPHVAIRLAQMISDPNVSVRDLEEVIRLDPTLIIRLLRLINSPYYGLRQKVESISMAVVYLGTEVLRNMVVLEALKNVFTQSQNDGFFARNQLWFHCSIVGICNQMISERIFRRNGEDAFLCGILHDVGMIVEDQVVPDLFAQACKNYRPNTRPITENEKEIIGTDHSAVSALLASEWNVSSEIRKGIKSHHELIPDISPSSLSGIIQISEYIACNQMYGAIPQMTVSLPPLLRKHIHENLLGYKGLVDDLPGEISKAKELYEL